MKFLVFFLLFCYSVSTVFAQEDKDSTLFYEAREGQRTILKTNLLPILWGNIMFPGDSGRSIPIVSEYRLIAEFPIAPKQALIIGISYLGKNLPVAMAIGVFDTTNSSPGLRNLAVRGFRIQGMYRWYISPNHIAPRGFYIGPHVSYSYAKVYFKPPNGYFIKLINSNFNFILGGQGLLWKRIAVDTFGGLGVRANFFQEWGPKGKMDSSQIKYPLGNIKLTLGMNIGYAF